MRSLAKTRSDSGDSADAMHDRNDEVEIPTLLSLSSGRSHRYHTPNTGQKLYRENVSSRRAILVQHRSRLLRAYVSASTLGLRRELNSLFIHSLFALPIDDRVSKPDFI